MEVHKTVCSAIGCALNSGRCVALGSQFTGLFVNYIGPVRSWVNVWLRGLLTLSTLWRKEEVLRSHGSSSWCQKAFYESDAASRPYMEAGQICSIPMHAQLQFDGMSFSNIMLMLLLLHLD